MPGQYFGRIQSISGTTITLFSPLPLLPVADELVTRFESIGYIYTAANNTSDNGSLAAAVDLKIYPTLNGLRALRTGRNSGYQNLNNNVIKPRPAVAGRDATRRRRGPQGEPSGSERGQQ